MTPSVLLSWFGRLAAPFLVPAKTASAVARRRGRGRPLGRRAQRAFLDGVEPGGKLPIAGILASSSRAGRAALLVGLTVLGAGAAVVRPVAAAEVAPRSADSKAILGAASARFGLPFSWIQAVIAVESGGDASAVSAKGAMGLMQLMPATWRQVRDELALGQDPFDRADNVTAGAAYLRQLYDRFGAQGAFAAYHAGPGRYAEHLTKARPLPPETRAYVASIHQRLGWDGDRQERANFERPSDWRAAPLFPEPGVRGHEGARR